MSSASLLRHAVRPHAKFTYRLQPPTRRLPSLKGRRDTIGCYAFTTSANRLSGGDADQEESFEEFTARSAVSATYVRHLTAYSFTLDGQRFVIAENQSIS